MKGMSLILKKKPLVSSMLLTLLVCATNLPNIQSSTAQVIAELNEPLATDEFKTYSNDHLMDGDRSDIQNCEQ
jgi:hypothetical protein